MKYGFASILQINIKLRKPALTALALILGTGLSVSAEARSSQVTETQEKLTLSESQRIVRLEHARELLGKYYNRSSAGNGEAVRKINGFVYRTVRSRLPKKYRKQHQKIAQTIIDESLKYQYDPVFLMSVIQGESSWRPSLVGGVGEIGLMQIRPSTAQWISKKLGLPFKGTEKELRDPVINIRIGAAYLSYLRERYDSHARLYLAAYNMGPKNVASALDKKIWPRDYPIHVMKQYTEFYENLGEERNGRSISSSQ